MRGFDNSRNASLCAVEMQRVLRGIHSGRTSLAGKNFRMKSKPSRNPSPDHVPGPMQEAAVRTFFERGSQQSLDKSRWRVAALLSMSGLVVMGVLLVVLASRQETYVMQVTKDSTTGELQVSGVAKTFEADEETRMAWAIDYAKTLTEISPAIWRRNVDRVVRMSSGVAADQVRTYLNRPDTNPAALLQQQSLYVREFHRKSVNKVASNTYLIRYDLVSRSAPTAPAVTNSFAMTITVAPVGHQSREDVFANPAGLAATNFSLSLETAPK